MVSAQIEQLGFINALPEVTECVKPLGKTIYPHDASVHPEV